MSACRFTWRGQPVPFAPGDTIAAALLDAGVGAFGHDACGMELRYFCGIGACQNCLVRLDGRVVEACLTPAVDGATIAAPDD